MKLLQNSYPEMKSHALEDLCSKFEVINEFQHHGKEDVQATFELLEKVAKEKKLNVLEYLIRLAEAPSNLLPEFVNFYIQRIKNLSEEKKKPLELREYLNALTVEKLKQVANKLNLPSNQLKSDLIDQIGVSSMQNLFPTTPKHSINESNLKETIEY